MLAELGSHAPLGVEEEMVEEADHRRLFERRRKEGQRRQSSADVKHFRRQKMR
jgi:hypothetical protein